MAQAEPPQWHHELPVPDGAGASDGKEKVTMHSTKHPGDTWQVLRNLLQQLPQAPFLALLDFLPSPHPPSRLQTLK